MDLSLEQKQTYLRKEVLQAGLDGNEFMLYLTKSNAQKGSDLQMWSIPQLEKIVAAFKATKSTVKVEPVQNANIAQQQLVVVDSPIKKPFISDDSTYSEDIQCQVKNVNSIYGKPLDIKVTRWEKVEGGFLQRSYIRFTVQVSSLNISVHRRFSQFQWLRSALAVMNPGCPLPPLPKKGKVVHYEDKYLNKRMYMLQKFLNTIAMSPQLASDLLFQRFLTVTDAKEFQKIKQHYCKIENIPLRKMRTIKGTINISTEKTMADKIVKYFEYLKQTQPEMRKIYKNFKGVATNLQNAAECLKGVKSNCQSLRKREEAIRVTLDLPELLDTCVFMSLQTFASEFAEQLTAQAKTFRKQIYGLSKYESFYKLSMIQTIQQLNLKQQEYLQGRINLAKKKQKLYSEGKVSKWGLKNKDQPKPVSKQQAFQIMLPKETSQLSVQRQVYALHNTQVYEECYRHTKILQTQMAPFIRQFIEMQFAIFKTMTQHLQTLVDVIKNVQQSVMIEAKT